MPDAQQYCGLSLWEASRAILAPKVDRTKRGNAPSPANFHRAALDPRHEAATANTVEVVWTTGTTVRRYSWEAGGYIDEQLVVGSNAVRLDRLNAGAPFPP